MATKKTVESVADVQRRLFNGVWNPLQIRMGTKEAARQDFNQAQWWTQGNLGPFDQTGLYKSKHKQIRDAKLARDKAAGRGPPKKGEGRKAKLKKK